LIFIYFSAGPEKGEAGLSLHRGGDQLMEGPAISFHFIGIYSGSTARCNCKKRNQLFIRI